MLKLNLQRFAESASGVADAGATGDVTVGTDAVASVDISASAVGENLAKNTDVGQQTTDNNSEAANAEIAR